MYGLVNLAVKDLICTKFGKEKWVEVVEEAGHTVAETTFLSMDQYDDAITLKLVDAASKVLKAPSPDIMEAVGYWWAAYLKKTGHGAVLAQCGSDLPTLLCNLNSLHSQIRTTYKDIHPPSIWVTHHDTTSLRLHYIPGLPTREGLCPMLLGVVKGLAEVHFKMKSTEVKQDKFASAGDHHDEFTVKWTELVSSSSDDDQFTAGDQLTDNDITSGDCRFNLSARSFSLAFPFHIVFDKRMKALQIGPSLAKHNISLENCELKLVSPMWIDFTYASLKVLPDEVFVIREERSGLLLRGQMLHSRVRKRSHLFFLCSPVIRSDSELQKLGFTFQDFATHDRTLDLAMALSQGDQVKREALTLSRSSAGGECPFSLGSVSNNNNHDDNENSNNSSSITSFVTTVSSVSSAASSSTSSSIRSLFARRSSKAPTSMSAPLSQSQHLFSQGQKQARMDFAEKCLRGEIEQRKFVQIWERQYLFDAIRGDSNPELQLRASRAAAAIMRHNATENNFSFHMDILDHMCLQALLHFACDDSLTVHIEVDRATLTLGEKIGMGASGSVFKGTYKEKEVAIKAINTPSVSSCNEFRRELALLSLLHHPHLLTAIGGHVDQYDAFIVTGLMDCSLSDKLADKNWDLTVVERLKIARDIASGMAFLHHCQLVHRDLKSSNVLLEEATVHRPTWQKRSTVDADGLVVDIESPREVDNRTGNITPPGGRSSSEVERTSSCSGRSSLDLSQASVAEIAGEVFTNTVPHGEAFGFMSILEEEEVDKFTRAQKSRNPSRNHSPSSPIRKTRSQSPTPLDGGGATPPAAEGGASAARAISERVFDKTASQGEAVGFLSILTREELALGNRFAEERTADPRSRDPSPLPPGMTQSMPAIVRPSVTPSPNRMRKVSSSSPGVLTNKPRGGKKKKKKDKKSEPQSAPTLLGRPETAHYNVRLADFGTARDISTDGQMTSTTGTVGWMAPEVFLGKKYSTAADVYSFGIVLWELWTRQDPFGNLSPFQVYEFIKASKRPHVPDDMDKDYAKLMKACWEQSPNKRPMAHAVVERLEAMIGDLLPRK